MSVPENSSSNGVEPEEELVESPFPGAIHVGQILANGRIWASVRLESRGGQANLMVAFPPKDVAGIADGLHELAEHDQVAIQRKPGIIRP